MIFDFYLLSLYNNHKQMVYDKSHLLLGKIKFIESSISISWDGDDYISVSDEFMTFELTLRNKKLKFDIIFDLTATCDWEYESGDYYTPDYYERTNVNIDVTVTSIDSESDIDFDLNDKEVSKILEKLVLSNIDL